MAKHNYLGEKGEDIAVEYLQDKMQIIKRNWRCKEGEIDIIAEDDEFIIFVEVKTRTSNIWGNPENAIDTNKIKRITNAANRYIIENCIDKPARFDVVSILFKDKKHVTTYFNDAFMPYFQ